MLRNFHYARIMCEALREGLTASHQYEHLRSRSIPHKTALNEALGIGVTPEAQRSPPPKQLESGSVRL